MSPKAQVPGRSREKDPEHKQPRVSLAALSGLFCSRFPWSPEGFQTPPEPRSVPKVTPRPPVLRLDISTSSPVPRSSLRAEARFEGASPSVPYCYVSSGSAVPIHSVTEAASFLSGCLLRRFDIATAASSPANKNLRTHQPGCKRRAWLVFAVQMMFSRFRSRSSDVNVTHGDHTSVTGGSYSYAYVIHRVESP